MRWWLPIWHSVRALPELSQVIRVPEAFVFQEGARVTEDLVAGKLLGDGVQGQVYVLKRPDGSSTDQLLKVRVFPSSLSGACLSEPCQGARCITLTQVDGQEAAIRACARAAARRAILLATIKFRISRQRQWVRPRALSTGDEV